MAEIITSPKNGAKEMRKIVKHENNDRTWLLCEVPDDASSAEIETCYLDFQEPVGLSAYGPSTLPQSRGVYSSPVLSAEMNYAMILPIVQDEYGKFPDFVHNGLIYQDRRESLLSLLVSNGFTPSTCVIVEKLS